MILTDEVATQLKRIADALSRPATSPWTEWAKALATLTIGATLGYASYFLQTRTGDWRKREKMRRVVYSELADAILWLYDMVHNLPPARNPSEPLTSQELKVGFRDPPSMKVINSPFTFEGEGYMGQDHSIAYQLPERQVLKRMYLELHKFSPGNSISVGEFKIPLIQISKEFKGTRVIRRSFKKYAGSEFRDLEKIVDYFARQEIKPEEVLRLMFRESNDARK